MGDTSLGTSVLHVKNIATFMFAATMHATSFLSSGHVITRCPFLLERHRVKGDGSCPGLILVWSSVPILTWKLNSSLMPFFA